MWNYSYDYREDTHNHISQKILAMQTVVDKMTTENQSPVSQVSPEILIRHKV